jgi:hypothetical protein
MQVQKCACHLEVTKVCGLACEVACVLTFVYLSKLLGNWLLNVKALQKLGMIYVLCWYKMCIRLLQMSQVITIFHSVLIMKIAVGCVAK